MSIQEEEPSQEPTKQEHRHLLGFWRLVALCALLPVMVAAGLYYYGEHSRRNCDRAASASVVRATAALEQLGSEVADLNLSWNPDVALPTMIATNALRYMVGPHYGWRGGSRKCEVLLRIDKTDTYGRVQGVALGGVHPEGPSTRYVHQFAVPGENERALIMSGIADARNGKSGDWNAYPYREARDGRELCYTESIVDPSRKPPAGRSFVFKEPKGVPCDQIRKLDYRWR
jgi:hypothetical protein